MDRKELYEKAEKAINQAFELTKQSVKVLSEKAGEAAQITKLMIEKATLEHRVSKQFTRLGSRLYEDLSQGRAVAAEDEEVKNLIQETQQLASELSNVEAQLLRERGKK